MKTFHSVTLNEIDFSSSENASIEAGVWMQARFNVPFNITKETLPFEQYLIKISEDEHWFFGKYHHLITDGYGFIVWVRYLAQKYKSLIGNDGMLFSYPNYVDEAILANEYIRSEDYAADAQYWNEKIASKPERLLQKKYHHSHAPDNKSVSYTLELSAGERKSYCRS